MARYGRYRRYKRRAKSSTASKVIKPFASVAGMVTKNTSLKYTLTGMFTIPVVLSVVYTEGWDWITGKVGDWGASLNNMLTGSGAIAMGDFPSDDAGLEGGTAMGDDSFSEWFDA